LLFRNLLHSGILLHYKLVRGSFHEN
jgi:hypothetical protein